MFWVIRWTDKQTSQDNEIVVEAESRIAAEATAMKRGIPVVFLGPAQDEDVYAARKSKRLWRYTPDAKYTFLGQPTTGKHVMCLVLCGIWTMVTILHNFRIDLLKHVPFPRIF